MEKRTYQITLIYHTTADEDSFTEGRESWEPEDIERIKRLLRAALNNQQAADYLMLKEAGYELGSVGEEGIVELLTGLDINDHTPVEAIVQMLPLEDQKFFSDSSDTEMTLNSAFQAELDQIHISRIDQQLAAQSESHPAKQRHHKHKQRRKK